MHNSSNVYLACARDEDSKQINIHYLDNMKKYSLQFYNDLKICIILELLENRVLLIEIMEPHLLCNNILNAIRN